MKHKRAQDEIVILYDEKNGNKEILDFLLPYNKLPNVQTWRCFDWNNNFADFKNATGNLGSTALYSWLDPAILDTSTYYRLNIFDNNGLSQLSPVRRVDPYDLSFNINIYPNPAGNENTSCSLIHNRVEPMRLEIFSADGKLVLSSNFYSEKGTLYFTFPAERLSRGLYTIRFSNSDFSINSSNRFIRH